MARRARVVLPGYPHHVTQRGIRRSEIFRDDNDKNIYKKIMRKHFIEFGVQIIAYCLMDNHVHFVCIPPFAESLALSIGQGHSTYSRYFNAKEGYVGHLFQNRFYSCAMSNDHAQACLRYVERNPVSAGCMFDDAMTLSSHQRLTEDSLTPKAFAACFGERVSFKENGFTVSLFISIRSRILAISLIYVIITLLT